MLSKFSYTYYSSNTAIWRAKVASQQTTSLQSNSLQFYCYEYIGQLTIGPETLIQNSCIYNAEVRVLSEFPRCACMSIGPCMSVSVYACLYAYLLLWSCLRNTNPTHTRTRAHIYIYIYNYI